jgi:hypothetical protein
VIIDKADFSRREVLLWQIKMVKPIIRNNVIGRLKLVNQDVGTLMRSIQNIRKEV